MISFLVFLVLFLVGGFSLKLFNLDNLIDKKEEEVNVVNVAKLALFTLLCILVSFFQPIAAERIDSGSVGLKVDKIGNDKAVELEQKQLTPIYIDYLRVQKWKGDVPSTVLGSNSNTLLNLKY